MVAQSETIPCPNRFYFKDDMTDVPSTLINHDDNGLSQQALDSMMLEFAKRIRTFTGSMPSIAFDSTSRDWTFTFEDGRGELVSINIGVNPQKYYTLAVGRRSTGSTELYRAKDALELNRIIPDEREAFLERWRNSEEQFASGLPRSIAFNRGYVREAKLDGPSR